MEDSATGSATGAAAQSSAGLCIAVGNGRISNFANVQAATFNLINNGSGDKVENRKFLSNVPNLLERNFIRRPEKSAMLAVQLHDNLQENCADSRVAVVQGIGGAGKTQLVLQYIKDFESDYQGVFWVSLVSAEAALQDVIEIYRLLSATEEFQSLDQLRLDQLMARINGLLVGTGRWLWILDNADNVNDRKAPGHIYLWAHMPQSDNVQVLITTRLLHLVPSSNGQIINVDEMIEAQAQELFWKGLSVGRAEASEKNQQVASHLISILGHHALAITMVSAAIGESTRMSKDFSIFLQQFKTSQRQVLDRFPDSLRSRYGVSLLTSWLVSFDAVQRRSQLAASLLQFLCFLNPNRLSLEMFEHAFEHDTNLNWTESLSKDLASRPTVGDISDALDILVSFSLLRSAGDSSVYTMHKLIHACTLQYVLDKQSKDIAMCATRFVCIAKTIDSHIAHCFRAAKSIEGRTREELLKYCDVLEASVYMLKPFTLSQAAHRIPEYLRRNYSQVYGERHRRTIDMSLHWSAAILYFEVGISRNTQTFSFMTVLRHVHFYLAEISDLGRFRGVDSFAARVFQSYLVRKLGMTGLTPIIDEAFADQMRKGKLDVALNFSTLRPLYSGAGYLLVQAGYKVYKGERHFPIHPYLLSSMWYTEELIDRCAWDQALGEGTKCLLLPARRFEINDLNSSVLLRIKVGHLMAQLKLSKMDEYQKIFEVFFRDLMAGPEASFVARLDDIYKSLAG